MDKNDNIRGEDIPIDRLIPLNERKMGKRAHNKLLASLKAVGLLEPLCVYKEGDRHVILDGYLRYKICLKYGVKSLPCYILHDKEAFTPNHYVSRLSPMQKTRMLRKSLEVLDKSTLANALGRKSIKHHLEQGFLKELHPHVVKAYDSGRIVKNCAKSLTFVKPDRQVEILDTMEKNGDFSATYARTQILKTPSSLCRKRKKKNPWTQSSHKKRELVKKLEEAENRYDFYSGLYRQYVSDLLKMCIYVRKLVTNEKIRAYLQEHNAEMLQSFETILFETEGKKVG